MTTPPPGPTLTVYYDGACPLCQAEIGHYRQQEGAAALCFVDVSQAGADTGADLTRKQALARFHVRRSDGRLLSGAAAFVGIWAVLPRWSPLARVMAVPGVLWLAERGYRLFLPVRPLLARLARRRGRMRG